MPRYFVGTSGWVYPEWRGSFYPVHMPEGEWLEYYAEQFKTVEINSTFYRLPSIAAVQKWYASTPRDFTFAVKLSRYITHMKQLHCDDELRQSLVKFFSAVKELRGKLAVVLVQLPSNFHRDDERLVAFIKMLSAEANHQKVTVRFAFEFRHASWFCEAVFSTLKQHRIASVINSAPPEIVADKTITTDFLYVRFHGAKKLYESNYSDKELGVWGDFAKQTQYRQVFAYFNNTADSHAIKNAKQFIIELTKEY